MQGDVQVSAQIRVQIVPPEGESGPAAGIPDPHPINAPGESWRSRVVDGRWEYNVDHADYLEASQSEARRLRYLVNLFAKEIVLRNFGSPGASEALERMVQVMTYLDTGPKR